MLMIRYFVLLLVYHCRSFLHMMPWGFVWGLLTWPVHLMRLLSLPPEHHKQCVATGTSAVLSLAETGQLPPMGAYLQAKFENIRKEALE